MGPVLLSVLVLPGLLACHVAQSRLILLELLPGLGPPLGLCCQSLLASLSAHSGKEQVVVVVGVIGEASICLITHLALTFTVCFQCMATNEHSLYWLCGCVVSP